MNIPTWAIVLAIPALYLLVGVLFAMLAAFRAGRRHEISFGAFEGMVWTFGWPIVCIVESVAFVMGKYDKFLGKIQNYGQESTLPPKNESDGRRIS